MSKLNISESFYSVQAEGATTGYPAYFIRLRGCNLNCGCSRNFIQKIRDEGLQPGDFKGDLHASGKATWTCDSVPVWIKGTPTTFQELVNKWVEEDILGWILDGTVHLIWTGGEPTMPGHQKVIVEFLEWLDVQYPGNRVYSEIETNGTNYIFDDLFNRLNQINCSVKLANSGMSYESRFSRVALERIMEHKNHWFKMVVSDETDILEIQRDFIIPLNIKKNKIILMPGLDDQADFHERTRFSLLMAKKYGYIGMTRLHISAWGATTGV